MEYTIVEKDGFFVAGFVTRTTNESHQAAKDIPVLWEKFLNSKFFSKDLPVMCCYLEYKSDFTDAYTVLIGHVVDTCNSVSSDAVCKKLPVAKYAVLTVEGPYPDSLLKAWQSIWTSDLKRSYTGDFEVYPAGFFDGGSKPFEIYVAVK